MQRLYAYVDETGQDTEGRFFLVSVVITEEEREQLQAALEQIEQATKKGIFKWYKTPLARRRDYLNALLATSLFQEKIFFAHYVNTRAYFDLTVYTTARAILHKATAAYKATILVDGLNREEVRRFEKGLRGLNITARKVRGLREESDPLMRLADAMAGFIRDALEGQAYAQALYKKALKKKIIREA